MVVNFISTNAFGKMFQQMVSKNKNFNFSSKQHIGLSFFPVDQVLEAIDIKVAYKPEIDKMIKYFEETWITEIMRSIEDALKCS